MPFQRLEKSSFVALKKKMLAYLYEKMLILNQMDTSNIIYKISLKYIYIAKHIYFVFVEINFY